MDDPIEIVARAAFEADWPNDKRGWDGLGPGHAQDRYRRIARAALLALREPTEGMVEAGAEQSWGQWTGQSDFDADTYDHGDPERAEWREVYRAGHRAAIDHALQTQEKGDG